MQEPPLPGAPESPRDVSEEPQKQGGFAKNRGVTLQVDISSPAAGSATAGGVTITPVASPQSPLSPQTDPKERDRIFREENPFDEDRRWRPLEIIRTVIVCLTLLPVRILLIGLILGILWIICKLNTCHRRDYILHKGKYRVNPSKHSRGCMRCFVQICTRSLLFVSGFYWIHVRRIKEKQPSWGEEDEEGGESLEEGTLSGSRKSRAKKRKFRLRRERPNVIVCNHPGGFDVPLLFLFFPNRFVAKAQFASAPFLGTIAKAFGCIFVLRESSEARRLVRESVSSIAKGEELGRWTLPLNMFPEGTTTNGRSLIRFQSGAFVAGAPVQPVVIQFPWCVFNPCWAAIGGGELFLRILFQVYGCATITILPPYYPSEAEKQDPILYATGVRAEMAKLGGMSELDVDFRDGLQWWSEYLRERKHKDVESPTIEKSVRRVADSGQVRERLRESLEMNTHLQEGGNRATGTEAVGEVRERTDTSPPVSSSPQTALLANQEREKGEAMQAVCSDQAGEVYDAGEEGNAQSHARTLSGMRDAIEEQETGEEKALREKNDWVVRETMILSIDASPPD